MLIMTVTGVSAKPRCRPCQPAQDVGGAALSVGSSLILRTVFRDMRSTLQICLRSCLGSGGNSKAA